MSRQFWKSGEQARTFERLVHDNPIRDGEGPIAYAERIALLAGELTERLILSRDVDLKRGAQERLPERVVGEDDDEE